MKAYSKESCRYCASHRSVQQVVTIFLATLQLGKSWVQGQKWKTLQNKIFAQSTHTTHNPLSHIHSKNSPTQIFLSLFSRICKSCNLFTLVPHKGPFTQVLFQQTFHSNKSQLHMHATILKFHIIHSSTYLTVT